MDGLKRYIKSHPLLLFWARQAKRFVLWVARLFFCAGAVARRLGFPQGRYRKLKELQGKYKGQRCFIVCSGPSLTLEDLQRLEGEVTFAVNSVIRVLPHTTWKPTFYGIQDPAAFLSLEKEISRADLDCILMPGSFARRRSIRKAMPKNTVAFPLDLLGHLTPHRRLSTRFSADCHQRVYDGYTVAYSMIQLAAYFGFSEIYLLGADCDYSGPALYFGKADYTTRAGKDVYIGMPQKLAVAYAQAGRWASAHGILLANATRGGALGELPRVSLEKALEDKQISI